MTQIAITASGTRGDVQPYIALAQGLKAAGCEVRVLTNDNFEPLVRDAGLDFRSTGESVEAVLQSEEWRETLEKGNFVSILARMQAELKQRAAKIAQHMPALLEGSDLIVTGVGGFGGVFSIAQALKIPLIQAYVFPFTPTNTFPGPLFPHLPFGAVLNRPSFHMTRQMLWQSSRVADVATRQVLGLPKGSLWGPFHWLKAVPALYGYSQHVLPRPRDWPADHHVTGYWFLDAPDDWSPPPDLVDFLDAGDPPIYIGFGSMGGRSPEEAGAAALDALRRSGQRGVLAAGWGGLKAQNLPDNVYLISSIPHAWLFPRMAAVVHHGGAGTTAAGLRAGVPSVIIPFMGDQPFWGRRVVDLGVGPAPIPRKKLTGQRLAGAITEAVSSTAMRQRASELGQKIRAEDGIANAVRLVHHFMQHNALLPC